MYRRENKKRTLSWIYGPCVFKKSTGIGLYSSTYVKKLKDYYEINEYCVPYTNKNLKRFLYQLLIFPFYMLIKRKDINILYEEGLIYLSPFLFFFKRNKKNVIIYHHMPKGDNLKTRWGTIKTKIIDKLSKNLLNNFDKIVVPSNLTKQELTKKFLISEKKIEVIYNAFDIRRFKEYIDFNDKEKERERLFRKYKIPYEKDELIFLNIGTDEDRKNLYTLIKAFSEFYLENKKISNIKIINIGKSFSNKNKAKIVDLIEKNNLPVFLLEEVPFADLVRFYFASDFYISPSIYEGFGRTVIEAQILEIPVVCSDIPIYREILKNSAIYVKNPLQVESWENFFYFVTRNKENIDEIRKKYILKGKKNISRFDVERLYKKWIDLIENL